MSATTTEQVQLERAARIRELLGRCPHGHGYSWTERHEVLVGDDGKLVEVQWVDPTAVTTGGTPCTACEARGAKLPFLVGDSPGVPKRTQGRAPDRAWRASPSSERPPHPKFPWIHGPLNSPPPAPAYVDVAEPSGLADVAPAAGQIAERPTG